MHTNQPQSIKGQNNAAGRDKQAVSQSNMGVGYSVLFISSSSVIQCGTFSLFVLISLLYSVHIVICMNCTEVLFVYVKHIDASSKVRCYRIVNVVSSFINYIAQISDIYVHFMTQCQQRSVSSINNSMISVNQSVFQFTFVSCKKENVSLQLM